MREAENASPGGNNFRASNVRELKPDSFRVIGGRDSAGEVVYKPAGHGRYVIHVKLDQPAGAMHPNAVLAAFLWGRTKDGMTGTEITFEISRFGDLSRPRGTFVIFDEYQAGQKVRVRDEVRFDIPANARTLWLVLDWNEDGIHARVTHRGRTLFEQQFKGARDLGQNLRYQAWWFQRDAVKNPRRFSGVFTTVERPILDSRI